MNAGSLSHSVTTRAPCLHTLRSFSISSLENVFTGLCFTFGAGMFSIGLLISNSIVAQEKNAEKQTHTLRMVFGNSGWVLPFFRTGW